jgi:hypothetical protein
VIVVQEKDMKKLKEFILSKTPHMVALSAEMEYLM